MSAFPFHTLSESSRLEMEIDARHRSRLVEAGDGSVVSPSRRRLQPFAAARRSLGLGLIRAGRRIHGAERPEPSAA